MDGWHFTRLPDGWQWHRISSSVGVATINSRAFESLLECLNDATKNGYALTAPSGSLAFTFDWVPPRS